MALNTTEITTLIEKTNPTLLAQCLIYLLIAYVLAALTSRIVHKIAATRLSAHHSLLFRHITFYVGLAFFVLVALKLIGVGVGPLLGTLSLLAAAGLFTGQVAVTNFLCGLFLITEKSFVVGDYLDIGGTVGELLSIDALSIKLRTKENTFVRIPNELLIKATFKNLSRFPIRRSDTLLYVSLSEDLKKIESILFEAVEEIPDCLISPPPKIQIVEFSSSALLLKCSVWTIQAGFDDRHILIQKALQAALTRKGVQLPIFTTCAASQP